MSFRYQRRVNLGNGLGLNLSKSGVSGSWRTPWGSIGSSGFSIRTGIPGLSYRKYGKGKKGDGSWLLLLIVFIVLALLVWNVIRLLVWVVAYSTQQFKKWREKRALAAHANDDALVHIGFDPGAFAGLPAGTRLRTGEWLVTANSRVTAGQPVLLLWDEQRAYVLEAELAGRLVPLVYRGQYPNSGDFLYKIYTS